MKRGFHPWFGAAVLLMALAFITGCSDSRDTIFSLVSGHAAGWVVDGHSAAAEDDAASCRECHGGDLGGGISNIGCEDCHLGGPAAIQPQGWGTNVSGSHGGYAASRGTDACSNTFCHGSNLDGVGGSGPSCSKCHPWPYAGGGHGEGWLPSGHAEQARQSTDPCKVCHGDDFSGGIAGVACSDCHLGGPTSPHPADWGTNILFVHGGFAATSGTDACANQYCHGVALDGVGGAGPSCSLCHSWPYEGGHPEGWVPGGHAGPAEADITACQICHGQDLLGGSTGVACADCHLGSGPSIHPDDWAGDAFTHHRAYVMQNGTDRCSNMYCHGTDLGGVVGSGPSCSTCHTWPFAGAHPSDWVPSGHGPQAQANINGCKVCHGDDFSGGIAGVACTDCHLGSETSFHPVAWGANALTEHRQYALDNGTGGCATQYCHGVDLDGRPPAAGPSCSSCHSWPFAPLHPDGWVPSGHVAGAAADIQSCTQCHGAAFEGDIGPACTNCHLGDQQTIHPTAWGTDVIGSHGGFAAQNGTDGCANQYCHGTNLDGAGGAAGPSCAKCHTWPYTGGQPAGWVPSGHEAAALADIVSCQLCHGTDYSGGVAGVACTDCHMGDESNKHPLPWGADAFNQHRLFVLQNGATGCSNVNCHGADLSGVVGSGPSCTTCHTWPVGHLTATWLPPDHMTKAQANNVVCQSCHGVDFQGGAAGVACVDCHLGDETSVHPLNWTVPINDHRAYASANGVTSCSNIYCHGADLMGASGNSCYQCHGQEW